MNISVQISICEILNRNQRSKEQFTKLWNFFNPEARRIDTNDQHQGWERIGEYDQGQLDVGQ